MRHLDWSIGQRLGLGFGSILLLLGLVLGFSLEEQQRVRSLERRLEEVIDPRARAAERVVTAYAHQAIALRSYAFTRSQRDFRDYERALQQGRQALGDLSRLPIDPEGVALFDEVRHLTRSYHQAAEQFLTALRQHKDPRQMRPAFNRLAGIRTELERRTDDCAKLQRRKRDAARAEIIQAQLRMTRRLLLLSVLVFAVGGLTAFSTTRSVRDPARRLVYAARALEGGDYEPTLALVETSVRPSTATDRPRSELTELSYATARMAGALRQRERRLTLTANLSTALAASIDVERLAGDALRQVIEYAGCEVGALYVREEGVPSLRRVASHALDGAAPTLRVGEGIPGQAAAEARSLLVRDIPADAPFRIRFGFEDLPPRAMLATPVIVRDEMLGVILVGSVRDLSEEARDAAEHVARLLGVSLQNALAHQQLALLADELQARNEQLAAQNEELEAQSEEIQAQNEELQAQFEELQAQSGEIAAQNEALEKADERKNQFLAMLAHELRNPLGAISNAFALLRRSEPGSASWERSIEVVGRQLRHQVRLVDDLLDVSRINRGKIGLHPIRLDLTLLVRETVQDWRRPLEEVGLTLDLSLPEEPVWIHGDPTRLSQALVNLLNNALKFTDSGGQVGVALAVDRPAERAVITVRDSGIGIEPEMLPHLFETFAQADYSLDRSRGGLGLGLALVKGLVERHGGEVCARSEGLGRGAEFSMRLPLSAGVPAFRHSNRGGQDRQDGRGGPPSSHYPVHRVLPEGRVDECSGTPELPSLRVLLVEDNPDAAETLRDLLELSGHEVEVARSGPAGVEAARHSLPDVVLCDIGLPGMDGYAVARALRNDPDTASLGLVALTGYGTEEDRQRALEVGFDRHLAKPVDPEQLQGLLAELVAEEPYQAEPAPAAPPVRAGDERAETYRILLVDDDPVVRGALSESLRQQGYEVATAANGREALDALRRQPLPRVILLDLTMPVMNGWTFRTEQLQDPELASIPVVILTNAGNDQHQPAFLDAAAYLSKPVDRERLLQIISATVHGATGKEAPRRGRLTA